MRLLGEGCGPQRLTPASAPSAAAAGAPSPLSPPSGPARTAPHTEATEPQPAGSRGALLASWGARRRRAQAAASGPRASALAFRSLGGRVDPAAAGRESEGPDPHGRARRWGTRRQAEADPRRRLPEPTESCGRQTQRATTEWIRL
ncbi:coiled-coil and C2 domain-containing protein 1-like [Phoca vitulina]|uniref:coiled-coil and C2 domain-containing protein 1-like n=1 Tax=Phoca vitulina TaxID=9720 RepID=UPI001395E179|nr:coiled-coil and C2 domain-containing protein 1-like [Phoca vitulina]